MIVVYRQGQALQDMVSFFNVNNPTELPFVDSTLGNVSVSGWRAFSETTRFFIPKNWSHLDDGTGSFVVYDDITAITFEPDEEVIFTDLSVLPLSIPRAAELAPRELYKKDELTMGTGFKSMKDFLTCKKVTQTDMISHLSYSLGGLAENILMSAGSYKERIGPSFVYSGPAHIDEDSEIHGQTKIYGPCIIVNSELNDTVVYPGSVIINSRVSNSIIETSYVHNTGVTNSRLEDTTAYSAVIDNSNVVGSVLPKLTQINGRNEKERLR